MRLYHWWIESSVSGDVERWIKTGGIPYPDGRVSLSEYLGGTLPESGWTVRTVRPGRCWIAFLPTSTIIFRVFPDGEKP